MKPTIKLLKKIQKQLIAMNCSASHAVSWVEPRADATTKMIKTIGRHIKKLDILHGR